MAKETDAAPASDDVGLDDDWAAAMAEQAMAEGTPSGSAQAANIFPSFDTTGNKSSLMTEV
jgi:flagellar motor switch protein FliN/FliY